MFRHDGAALSEPGCLASGGGRHRTSAGEPAKRGAAGRRSSRRRQFRKLDAHSHEHAWLRPVLLQRSRDGEFAVAFLLGATEVARHGCRISVSCNRSGQRQIRNSKSEIRKAAEALTGRLTWFGSKAGSTEARQSRGRSGSKPPPSGGASYFAFRISDFAACLRPRWLLHWHHNVTHS